MLALSNNKLGFDSAIERFEAANSDIKVQVDYLDLIIPTNDPAHAASCRHRSGCIHDMAGVQHAGWRSTPRPHGAPQGARSFAVQ